MATVEPCYLSRSSLCFRGSSLLPHSGPGNSLKEITGWKILLRWGKSSSSFISSLCSPHAGLHCLFWFYTRGPYAQNTTVNNTVRVNYFLAFFMLGEGARAEGAVVLFVWERGVNRCVSAWVNSRRGRTTEIVRCPTHRCLRHMDWWLNGIKQRPSLDRFLSHDLCTEIEGSCFARCFPVTLTWLLDSFSATHEHYL